MTILRGNLTGSGFTPYYGDVSIIGNLTSTGDIVFTGGVYDNNANIVSFSDLIIELNSSYTGSAFDGLSGFEVQRGTEPNAGLVYDGSTDSFLIGKLDKEALLTSTNSGPYTFGSNNKFKINMDSIGSVEITLSDGTTEEVVEQLNSALYNSEYDYINYYPYFQVTKNNKIRIKSHIRGTSSQIDIETITNDSYTVLGLSVSSTTNGVDATLVELGTGNSIPYVPTATENNIAIFDDVGGIKDSGNDLTNFSPITHNHDSDYISKVPTATEDNFASFNVTGEVQDSLKSASDFADAIHGHNGSEITIDDSGFSGNLVGGGTDSQTLFETIDGLSLGDTVSFNVESITGPKALIGTDAEYQYLAPDSGNKQVSLPTSSVDTGKRFIIKNTAGYSSSAYLTILQGATTLDIISAKDAKEFIYDGTNWQAQPSNGGYYNEYNTGYGWGVRSYYQGSAFGYGANGFTFGSSFGYNSNGYQYGSAFGSDSLAPNYGCAFGRFANGSNYGSAIGYNTLAKYKSIAIGSYSYASNTNSDKYNIAIGVGDTQNPTTSKSNKSAKTTDTSSRSISLGHDTYVDSDDSISLGTSAKCVKNKQIALGGVYTYPTRYGEQKTSSDDANKFSRSRLTFYGNTTNDTLTELFLDNSSERLTLVPNSILSFDATVVGSTTNSEKCAKFEFKGLIRRDSFNNTTILGSVTKTTIIQIDNSWDCNFTGDDTNEALVLKVTGGTGDNIQWMSEVQINETVFDEVDSDLFLYWPNGSGVDISLNHIPINNITGISYNYSTIKTGNFSTQFTGTNSYMRIANSALNSQGFGNIDQPFTVDFWIYPTSNNTDPYLYDSRTTAGAAGTTSQLLTTNKQIRFFFADGIDNMYVDSENSVWDYNGWYHIVFTYDGSGSASGCSLKVNNISKTLNTINDNLTTDFTGSGSYFYFGAYQGNLGLAEYTGFLSTFVLWTKVLDASEITERYNSGNGLLFEPQGLPVKQASMILHMDGSSEDSTYNYTPTDTGVTYSTITKKLGTHAAQFADGSGHYINVGQGFSKHIYDAFTIEGWIQLDSDVTATTNFLFSNQNTSSTFRGISLYTTKSTGNVYANLPYNNGSTQRLLVSTPGAAFPLDQLNHVVLRYNGYGSAKGIDIFVNNTKHSLTILSDTCLGRDFYNTDDGLIGEATYNSSYYQKGFVDEFIVHDYALTDQQVADRYNSGNGLVLNQ